MDYDEFYERIIEHMANYKNNILGVTENGYYKGEPHKHILPGGMGKNFLKDNYNLYKKYCNEERLNTYCNHLNSSQIMCMNFFLPMLEDSQLFNTIIAKQLEKDKESLGEIVDFFCNAIHDDENQFDIYVEYSSGIRLYIETKYSEQKFRAFNGASRDKSWEEKYKDFAKNSLYLKDIDKEEFFRNFQINKNIGLIKDKNDYVVFIYPFDNEKIAEKLENYVFENVLKIDWDTITYDTLKNISEYELEEYYKEFSMKYLIY